MDKGVRALENIHKVQFRSSGFNVHGESINKNLELIYSTSYCKNSPHRQAMLVCVKQLHSKPLTNWEGAQSYTLQLKLLHRSPRPLDLLFSKLLLKASYWPIL